jgi:phage replication O-like protein O
MASPELSNGFTPIANELLEAILRTPLSSREQKCLLAVARETYGWSRKAKTVTAYRVATLTGMQRTQAARALSGLKQRNILLNGAGGIGLQKNYEAWIPPVRSKSDRVRIRPRNRVQIGPGNRVQIRPL